MQTYSTQISMCTPSSFLCFYRMDEACSAAMDYSGSGDLKFSPPSYKNVWHNWLKSSRSVHYTYNQEHNSTYDFCFMKQNCHFQRCMAQCKHTTMPLSSYSINTTHQGFQKRYITLFYLKGLKSYQPSSLKVQMKSPIY